MSLPYIGKCVLCGAENEAVNEGICAKHSDETAQAYLFGFADGKAAVSHPVEPSTREAEALRDAARKLSEHVIDTAEAWDEDDAPTHASSDSVAYHLNFALHEAKEVRSLLQRDKTGR